MENLNIYMVTQFTCLHITLMTVLPKHFYMEERVAYLVYIPWLAHLVPTTYIINNVVNFLVTDVY